MSDALELALQELALEEKQAAKAQWASKNPRAAAEFNYEKPVMSAGKMSREIKAQRDALMARMERDREELESLVRKEDQLRQRKAEKERAIRIAQELAASMSVASRPSAEPEVIVIDDDDDMPLVSLVGRQGKQEAEPDLPMRDLREFSLGEETLAILQREISKPSPFYKPFWFSKKNYDISDRARLRYKTQWTPFGKETGETYKLVNRDRNNLQFLNPGQTRKFSAGIDLEYGIPVSQKTSYLPRLIPKSLKKQYIRAEKTSEALLRAIMEIVPGFDGYAKKGVGRLTRASKFMMTNVYGTVRYFGIEPDEYGRPELVASSYPSVSAGYSKAGEEGTGLSPVTLRNVQALIEGYDKFYASPLNIAGTASRFAPHILASRNLEIDPTVYIDRATANVTLQEEARQKEAASKARQEQWLQQAIARSGISEGDLIMARVFFSYGRGAYHEYYDFYQVAAKNGSLTDGEGGLYVFKYKSRGMESTTRPSYDTLIPQLAILRNSDFKKVPDDQVVFPTSYSMGD